MCGDDSPTWFDQCAAMPPPMKSPASSTIVSGRAWRVCMTNSLTRAMLPAPGRGVICPP